MIKFKLQTFTVILGSMMIFSSCVEQPAAEVLEEEPIAVNYPAPGLGDDKDAHEPVEAEAGPSDLGVSTAVSKMLVSSELSQTNIIQLSFNASDYFLPGVVDLEIDDSQIAATGEMAMDYIELKLSKSKVDLVNNNNDAVTLEIKVDSMAPSFSAKQVTIRMSAEQGASGVLEKFVTFNLEVKPQITIGILSDAVPRVYTHGKNTFVRAHAGAGVQVVFQNMTSTFGLNGDGPCIHTNAPLKHCDRSNRMSPGEKYLPPKVMAGDYSKPVYYDHYKGADSIGRRIHFNVKPGEEDSL